MSKIKQIADVKVRVFPSTRKRLKVEAAKREVTIAELIDLLV